MIILVFMVLVLVEICAHFYMRVHNLHVLTKEEALRLVLFYYNGSKTFSGSGASWLAVWRIKKPTSSINFAYVYLFKIEQKGSPFVLSTDIAIIRIEPSSNSTSSKFYASIDEIIPEAKCLIIVIKYDFGEIGTYQIDFGLHVKIYEKTFLGYLPKEDVKIPIQAILYYGP
ncbi:MAG: hypothetical protein QXJ07_02285 [Candidatus Bathyarchaeia archaeon]